MAIKLRSPNVKRSPSPGSRSGRKLSSWRPSQGGGSPISGAPLRRAAAARQFGGKRRVVAMRMSNDDPSNPALRSRQNALQVLRVFRSRIQDRDLAGSQ
jgi:hypothetical protein